MNIKETICAADGPQLLVMNVGLLILGYVAEMVFEFITGGHWTLLVPLFLWIIISFPFFLIGIGMWLLTGIFMVGTVLSIFGFINMYVKSTTMPAAFYLYGKLILACGVVQYYFSIHPEPNTNPNGGWEGGVIMILIATFMQSRMNKNKSFS